MHKPSPLSWSSPSSRASPSRRIAPATAPTSRAEDLARVRAVTAPTDRFLAAGEFRADAGRARRPSRSVVNRDIFSFSLANLTFEQEEQFKLGNALFRKLWVVVAVLDPGLRWARAAVQCARLPELPPEGRARSSAARRWPRERGLDVPAPFGAAAAMPTQQTLLDSARRAAVPRADLWRRSCRTSRCPGSRPRARW